MKLRCVSFVLVLLALGMASVASANIVAHVGLVYQGSYNSNLDSVTPTTTLVTDGNGISQTRTIYLDPANLATYNSFDVVVTITGLTTGQDVVGLQWNQQATGSVDALPADLQSGFTANNGTVDPASMGPPTSNAPSATWASTLQNNGYAYTTSVRRGTSTGGLPGNTYGDYAAYMQLGEGAGTDLGNQVLNVLANASGSYSFLFFDNPGYLKIISGNTNGAATDVSAESYPAANTITWVGDTVNFVPVPEPSTIALLASGLFGLLAYAWRKRK
jgi:hypothetical protein